MTLQSLILGDQRIDTERQKRKVLLGAYLILTFLGVDTFFFFMNALNPEGEPWALLLGSLISVVCLGLIRRGWINTAIFLYLIRSNLVTFYFSLIDTDPYQTGTFAYFIPSSLGALAVFGYGERWKGIGFSLLSFLLFLTAFLDPSRFTVDNAHFYFIVNVSIVLLVGMLIILFFDHLVVGSERVILRKNEELVEANKELLKTNKELDLFVYSASHDLRAPLSSMLGLIEIVQFTKDPEETRRYLELIKGRVQVLDSFIREIIDYSRNSRIEPKIEPVQVRSLIEEVIEQLQFLPGSGSMRLDIDLARSWSIPSDKIRLKVVFDNIISNAIKYRNPSNEVCSLRISAKEKVKPMSLKLKTMELASPRNM